MREHDIYFDEQKTRYVFDFDGINTTKLSFVCSATKKDIEDEIQRRCYGCGLVSPQFEELEIEQAYEILEVFKKSEALLDAVASCNEILVDDLLKSGADPNYQAPNGKTALMMAAQYGYESHYGMVELLVNAGASLDIKDGHGLTAFNYANEVCSDETWKPYIADFLENCMFSEKAAGNKSMASTVLTPFRIAITEIYVKEVEIYAPDEASAHQMAEDLCWKGDIELDHDNFVDRSTECRGMARPIDLELHDVYGKEVVTLDEKKQSLDSIVSVASKKAQTVSDNKNVRTELIR